MHKTHLEFALKKIVVEIERPPLVVEIILQAGGECAYNQDFYKNTNRYFPAKLHDWGRGMQETGRRSVEGDDGSKAAEERLPAKL